LTAIYERYGYQGEATVSIYREGKTGQEKISAAMESLRRNRADGIPGAEVTAVLDYLSGERLNIATGECTDTALKGSNVMLYELAGPSGHDWMCVRPSGTEPKIKIYYGIYDQDQTSCDRRLREIKEKTLAHLDNLLA
ncbi:MAG: phospho-sugar mutase, partial [Clostridiales bacterium]|nr:phospho-sugar mutase [Clostridiales bacterium]